MKVVRLLLVLLLLAGVAFSAVVIEKADVPTLVYKVYTSRNPEIRAEFSVSTDAEGFDWNLDIYNGKGTRVYHTSGTEAGSTTVAVTFSLNKGNYRGVFTVRDASGDTTSHSWEFEVRGVVDVEVRDFSVEIEPDRTFLFTLEVSTRCSDKYKEVTRGSDTVPVYYWFYFYRKWKGSYLYFFHVTEKYEEPCDASFTRKFRYTFPLKGSVFDVKAVAMPIPYTDDNAANSSKLYEDVSTENCRVVELVVPEEVNVGEEVPVTFSATCGTTFTSFPYSVYVDGELHESGRLVTDYRPTAKKKLSLTFDTLGEHTITVKLELLDPDASDNAKSAVILVKESNPPVVELNVSPEETLVGEPVRVEWRVTDDSGVDEVNVTCGNDVNFTGMGEEGSVECVYDEKGVYTIVVRAVDVYGNVGEATAEVVVKEPFVFNVGVEGVSAPERVVEGEEYRAELNVYCELVSGEENDIVVPYTVTVDGSEVDSGSLDVRCPGWTTYTFVRVFDTPGTYGVTFESRADDADPSDNAVSWEVEVEEKFVPEVDLRIVKWNVEEGNVEPGVYRAELRVVAEYANITSVEYTYGVSVWRDGELVASYTGSGSFGADENDVIDVQYTVESGHTYRFMVEVEPTNAAETDPSDNAVSWEVRAEAVEEGGDTTPPSVTITDPSEGSYFYTGEPVDVVWRSYDDSGVSYVTVDCGNGVKKESLPASGQTTCTYTSAGTYTIVVRAVDVYGNVGADSVKIYVKAPETPEPEVNITEWSYDGSWTEENVVFEGTAKNVEWMEVVDDAGREVGTCELLGDTFTCTVFAEGEYNAFLRYGNSETAKSYELGTIRIDRSDPVINVILPEEDAVYEESVPVDYTVEDLTDVSSYVDCNGDGIVEFTGGSEGSFTCTYTEAGTKTLVIGAADLLGHTTEVTVTFTVTLPEENVETNVPEENIEEGNVEENVTGAYAVNLAVEVSVPSRVRVGTAVDITVSVSADCNTGTVPYRAEVNVGDGAVEEFVREGSVACGGSDAFTVSYTPTRKGTYTVKVRVAALEHNETSLADNEAFATFYAWKPSRYTTGTTYTPPTTTTEVNAVVEENVGGAVAPPAAVEEATVEEVEVPVSLPETPPEEEVTAPAPSPATGLATMYTPQDLATAFIVFLVSLVIFLRVL